MFANSERGTNMVCSGILKEIKVRTNDTDKYVVIRAELDPETDIQELNSLLLTHIQININPT